MSVLPSRGFFGFLAIDAVALFACACVGGSTTPKVVPTLTSAANGALVPGPVPGTRLTEEYVRQVGRTAYLWGWPMVNLHNRKLAADKVQVAGLLGGVAPIAPPNHLVMLTDYVEAQGRTVPCPNQDVVYGQSVLALDREPVVVQVPDFGKRFWVYQAVDQRTDGFAELGAMYGTKPGAYLLAGPDWKGKVPKGIVRVFRSPTNVGMLIPRVFKDDTLADADAVQPLLAQIASYPLSEFNGKWKKTDWRNQPRIDGEPTTEDARWVVPERFFDELPRVLAEVPPLPGEAAFYEQMRSVLAAAEGDPSVAGTLRDAAIAADRELVTPLQKFQNWGLPLANDWTTITNGAAFGTDYFTRTAVAKSNILVNRARETKYFYQDLDETGARLSGAKDYTVTFERGQLPPVKGFWSLTLYDDNHFFHPNVLQRHSLGTKSKALKENPDGSLTIYVGLAPPRDRSMVSNWLPAPQGAFSLYLCAYWPEPAVLDGTWTPPAVTAAR